MVSGSLPGGGVGVSLVGCSTGRFSKGDGEVSFVGCSYVRMTYRQDGSSGWDGWSLMPQAAENSSILLTIHSIRSASAFISFSAMSKRGSDTKLLRSSVTGDERCIIWMGNVWDSRVFEVP